MHLEKRRLTRRTIMFKNLNRITAIQLIMRFVTKILRGAFKNSVSCRAHKLSGNLLGKEQLWKKQFNQIKSTTRNLISKVYILIIRGNSYPEMKEKNASEVEVICRVHNQCARKILNQYQDHKLRYRFKNSFNNRCP